MNSLSWDQASKFLRVGVLLQCTLYLEGCNLLSLNLHGNMNLDLSFREKFTISPLICIICIYSFGKKNT